VIDESRVVALSSLPYLIGSVSCLPFHDIDAIQTSSDQADELSNGGASPERLKVDQNTKFAAVM
jgi:hypothetical protein